MIKILFFILVFFSSSIFAIELTKEEKRYVDNLKKIKVCSDPTWHSFIHSKDDKKVFTNDYLIEVLKKIGLEEEMVFANTWSESLLYLKEKKCDIIAVIKKTQERSKYINFTKPYISYPLLVITHNNTPYLYDLNDLDEKKIVMLKSHAGAEDILKKYKNLEIVYVDNGAEALKKVQNKEVYGYVDLLPVFIHILRDYKNIKINREVDLSFDLSIGVRDDDPLLFNIIQNSLDSIEPEEKNKIMNRLVDIIYHEELDLTIFYEILFLAFSLLLFALYWNFKLKKRIRLELIKSFEQEKLLLICSKQDSMKDMVGNINHQWRRPIDELSSIISYLETKQILNKELTQDEINEALKKERKVIDFLSDTISIFTNFYSKNDTKLYSVYELIENVVFILEGTLKSNQIHISIVNNDKNTKIKGNQIQQVILSLFNNIIDLSKERKIKNPKISINQYEKNDHIFIEIEDNCGGIMGNIDEIFNSGKTACKKGTGLGLYISKRILVDKYNGEIYAQNSNEGAIFKIKIPL